MPLLQVKNLTTSFQLESGWTKVVDGVSFSLDKGKTLGIIGESGCGKTVTSLSMMRLIPTPTGRIDAGEVWLNDQEILSLPIQDFRKLRGSRVSMIFQDPMTSLNPVLTLGEQMVEVLSIHQGLSRAEAMDKAATGLDEVGLADPRRQLKSYPHQLSGGMKQRVIIAMALLCKPDLLIADEPTTALDVTIQAQILKLLERMRDEMDMGLLMITHDLGVVAQTCDEVAVMYAGKIVERAKVQDLFKRPAHPYTQGLIRSIQSLTKPGTQKLYCIEGMVPPLGQWPQGCSFQNRCPNKTELCQTQEPRLEQAGDSLAACHHPFDAA